jgi:hypothetical protein
MLLHTYIPWDILLPVYMYLLHLLDGTAMAWMKSLVFIHLTQLPSNPILDGVGHCYAWHVRVTFCIGNVCSLSYFQFGAIGGLYMLYHTYKQKN